jgi:hypothetical protein
MSDMRRLLEAMDSMSRAETKPTGPKFPGYWKGTDPASAAKNKMVGGAEESVIPELAKTAKKKSTEWELEEAFRQFKEGEFRRDVIPQQQAPVNTKLDPGYGKPLDKLPDPVGDQSGGFKKVLPGEKFDKDQWSLPGKPSGTPDLPVTPNNNTAPNINVATGTADKALQPDQPKVNPPVTDPQYTKDMPPRRVGQPGSGFAATREYIPVDTENPVRTPALGIRPTSKTQLGGANTDISPEENDEIDQQIQQQNLDRRRPTFLPSIEPVSQTDVDTSNSNISTSKLNPFSNASKSQQLQNISRQGQSTVNIGSSDNKGGQVLTPATSTNEPVVTQSARPGSWQELAKLNNITDPTKLRAGQTIQITPYGDTYTVKQNDTLGGIAKTIRDTGMAPGTGPSSTSTNTVPPAVTPAKPPTTSKVYPGGEAKRKAATTTAPEINYSQEPTVKSTPTAPDNRGYERSAEQKAADQAALAAAEKADRARQKLKPDSPQSKNKPKPSIAVPEPASQSAPATNISSQAAQDAQWEKDKERMKGLLPDWIKNKLDNNPAPANPSASPSSNDARRQADIAALQREISRTPTKEKTRLGILNKELSDRQKINTNETLSQKLARDFEQFLESDEPYSGYDQDVEKLKQRAKLGPMKTVWDEKTQRYRVVPVKPQEKQIKEYGNAQDADQQATNANQQQTSQTGNQQAIDQQVDIATAKSTMSGLKNVLGPQLNTNAAASGIVKMNDGKPLSSPEQQAISTLTPLVSKAAENPATASALKSALSTAGMLAKQGK